MKKFIYITADTNDGDYIHNLTEITDEEFELLQPIIDVLQKRADKLNEDVNRNWNTWRKNWPSSEYIDESIEEMYADELTQDQIHLLEEYIPYGEYGIHTIEEIRLFSIAEEQTLFNIRNHE